MFWISHIYRIITIFLHSTYRHAYDAQIIKYLLRIPLINDMIYIFTNREEKTIKREQI